MVRSRAADRAAALHQQAALTVVGWLPGLDGEAVRAVVERAAPGLGQAERLVAALSDRSVLQASTTAPRVVDRLVVGLVDLGAEGIAVPCCVRCGRSEWLTQRVDGHRACSSCARALRTKLCAQCGRDRPVEVRRTDGAALCSRCAPRRREPCGRCGIVRVIVRRVDDGTGLCASCNRTRAVCTVCGHERHCNGIAAGRPRCGPCGNQPIVCSWCGRTAPSVSAQWATGPVCSTCRYRGLEAKATCEGCGQWRRPDPRHPSGRCADCVGLAPFNICSSCGLEDRIFRHGRCIRCVMVDLFDTLTGDAAIDVAGLRAVVAASDRPRAVFRWLQEPFVSDTIRRLAQGDLALDHRAFDELGNRLTVNRLRAALVAAGLLAERDEALARFESWITEQLAAMAVVEDRRAVEAFATWHVLRRRRRRAQRTPTGTTSAGRRVIARAIQFLDFLRAHDRDLASCTQADLELWLSGPPTRRHVHDFVKWAYGRGLCGRLVVPAIKQGIPARQVSSGHVEQLVSRLLADGDLALIDRVAGLFIACYGQTPGRLVRLTTDHITIDGDHVTVRFGRDDVVLPPPIAAVVAQFVTTRQGRSAISPGQQRWLFPGGLPGRPLHHEALAHRLRRAGIDPHAVRTTSLLDLATEVPATILADLVGLYPGTASRWTRAAGGDWAAYAATKTRQDIHRS